jgi:putative ABC transport system permease protein
MSSFFVAAQFFAASFLLIAVIVMGKQNSQLRLVGFGAGDDPVVAITNNLRSSGIDMGLLRTELLRQPQVQAVTATMFPLGIMANDAARISQSKESNARQLTVPLQLVDYDFFSTMQISVLAGRVFDRAYGNDASSADSERPSGNIVIDLALAQRMGWKTAPEALGHTMYVPGLANGAEPNSPSTVIGVVEEKPLFALNMGGTGTIYQLVPALVANPLIRISKSDIPGALAAIDSVWKRIAPNTAMQRRFLDEQFAQGLVVFDLITGIFSRLAVFALVISSVGLMGMAAHIVGRRTHEIGVRKALGASVRQVLLLLLKDFSRPVMIANVIAWPLAFGAMSIYLSAFVTRTSLTLIPFVASLFLTLAFAWLAVIVQATRAARMNPATVLRAE